MFNQETHPYVYSGYQYALDIVNGDISSCIYIFHACKRFLKDIEDAQNWERYQKDPDSWKGEIPDECKFYFDEDCAESFLTIGQKFKHVVGRWSDPYIIFEPWQCFIFNNLFGFISYETGERRFRHAHIEVARGNAKSTLCSILGLIFLCVDRPNGNHVYSLATKKDQARIVFDSSRQMALKNAEYRRRFAVKVQKHDIVHPDSGSYFKPLSSDTSGLDGLNAILAIIDELHAHKTRDLFDVIYSGMDKRSDSLLVIITTAGFNTDNVGYSESNYAKKIALGKIDNDAFFSLVYTLDTKIGNEEYGVKVDDDPFDESNWIKANPNMGASVSMESMRKKALKAVEDLASKNNFLVKNCNLWTNSTNPFFNMTRWDECKDESIKLSDFYNSQCFVGIDLAQTLDFTAQAFVFLREGKYYIFCDTFTPEENITEISKRVDQLPQWVEDGHLILTPGETINYDEHEDWLLKKKSDHIIKGCHFDKFSADQMAQNMIAKGIDMIQFNMNVLNLSYPTKRLDALIRDRKIVHDGNPVLRWAIENVHARLDTRENVYPQKETKLSYNKIDPAIAVILALAGLVTEEEKSVYEHRDILIL